MRSKIRVVVFRTPHSSGCPHASPLLCTWLTKSLREEIFILGSGWLISKTWPSISVLCYLYCWYIVRFYPVGLSSANMLVSVRTLQDSSGTIWWNLTRRFVDEVQCINERTQFDSDEYDACRSWYFEEFCSKQAKYPLSAAGAGRNKRNTTLAVVKKIQTDSVQGS